MHTTIALAAVGLDTYWPQFPGLRERLDACRRRLAGELSADGVRIEDLGLVDSVAAARAAAAQARRGESRLLVLWLSTYALSGTILPLVQDCGCPVLVAALQPGAALDIPAVNALGDRGAMTGTWLGWCQACSAPEVANVFHRVGLDLRLIAGHLEDPGDLARLRAWVAAAVVRERLRGSTIGLLGGYYDGMLDIHSDVTGLSGTFGCRFRVLEYAALEERRRAVDAAGIAAMRRRLASAFAIDPACSASELERAAATAAAFARLAEDEALSALAYYYEGRAGGADRDLVTSAIPGLTLLTGAGIPCAGEYEVKNAVAMLICQLIAGGGSFSEFYAADFTRDEILLGHDGPGHPVLAADGVRLVPLPVYHGKPGTGLSIGMSVRPGPVTLLSVVQRGGRTVLLSAEGEAVPGPVLAIGNTNSRYRFPMPARAFIEAWSAAGPAHHCAIAPGHHGAAMARLADLCGAEHQQV
jgi:L-arabinose isomerase